MKKTLVTIGILFLVIVASSYFQETIKDNVKEEGKDNTSTLDKTKVPLYYNIDNPKQALVLEDDKFIEVEINGKSNN